MQLRPYQLEMLHQVRAAYAAGHRSVLLQAPTGSGKTAIAMYMLHQARLQGHSAWFLVHRQELVEQAKEAALAEGVEVEVCMVQTLVRRMKYLTAPDIVVWDEAHHCPASS